MNVDKPMTILIIEDDDYDCNAFQSCIDRRNDIQLVGITNSSNEGIEMVKTYLPEGIILDIELNRGSGSGLQFLYELQETDINFKPVIFVTTNALDEVLYDKLHSSGVSLIFHKKQDSYSHNAILDQIVSLRKSVYRFNIRNNKGVLAPTPAEHTANISNRIAKELDKIGIPTHLKGRKHLHDAILYLIEHDEDKNAETVFNYLARISNKKVSSVTNAMQIAINYAWRVSPLEDLEANYTYKIQSDRGVPSNTEFIYNYKDKIMRTI
jgi:two-component system response regulator (stage 0 sporulation protein A)